MKTNAVIGENSRATGSATSRTPGKTKWQQRFKSIVVPVDFSETSIKALDYAVALAKEFDARIHLVHVLEFPAIFNNASNPSYVLWNKEAKRLATERLAELIGAKVNKSIQADYEVRFGRAFQTIDDAAREQKADLIVIGTHGFTGLKHLLLGSTAERVLRHAPCSVLTVCSQHSRSAKSVVHPKKIFVPTDFSEPGDAALQAALSLAQQYPARLHLLHVVPVHYAVGDYDQIDFQMLETEEKEVAEKELSALSKALAAKKIAVKAEIRHGRPATEITNAAEELDADLIVISTHGRTGWQRAFLGSTTEEVVRHSSLPVLVVREKIK